MGDSTIVINTWYKLFIIKFHWHSPHSLNKIKIYLFILPYACSHGSQVSAESSDNNEEKNPRDNFDHKKLEQWEVKNMAETIVMGTMEVDDETG